MQDSNDRLDSLWRADAIVDQIRPMLAKQPPDVQGAVVAELVAIFIAGHHPWIRDESKKMVLDLIDQLIPIIVDQMIEAGSAGEEWRDEDRRKPS